METRDDFCNVLCACISQLHVGSGEIIPVLVWKENTLTHSRNLSSIWIAQGVWASVPLHQLTRQVWLHTVIRTSVPGLKSDCIWQWLLAGAWKSIENE